MTDDEIDLVAAELAKAGGVSWYPGRERGPLKLVTERYRDRARLAIAALDRYRARQADAPDSSNQEERPETPSKTISPCTSNSPQVGSMVLFRPAGDKRAYLCRLEKIEGDRAFLVPDLKAMAGWVNVRQLSPSPANEVPETE
jgi:hypothetical protein